MKLLRDLSPQLALAGIVALQISCGDSSGPGDSAASIAANSATSLSAAPGTAVAELPSVVVRDAAGNPLSGVTVNFTVTGGGGSVTGNHPTSNASGVATVGSWTLGPNQGTNTLVAAAGSLSVTFTANGADPCTTFIPHAIGSTTNAELSSSDCRLGDGSFTDLYQVTIPAAGTYIFGQTSTAFDTYLWLLTTSGATLAVNDDINPQIELNSRIKAILPAGTFLLAANSFDPNQIGSYSLTSAASAAEITNCEDVFVLAGINTAQSLRSTDCNNTGNFADEYLIFLQAGQAITASMSSGAVDSYLEILEILGDGSTTIRASNDNIDGTTQNAQLTFSPTTTHFYIIRARTTVAGATGAYTLAIQ